MPTSVTFSDQNCLITPAALAVNEPAPQDIGNQQWLLVLSGVTIIDLQGNLASDWLRQTLTMSGAHRHLFRPTETRTSS